MNRPRGFTVSTNPESDIGKSPTWEVPRLRDVGNPIRGGAATIHRLNEDRRALLKEIDNAKFS